MSDIVSIDPNAQYSYLKGKELVSPGDYEKFLRDVALWYDIAKARYYEDYGCELIPSHFFISDLIDDMNLQLIEIYCEENLLLAEHMTALYMVDISTNLPSHVSQALADSNLQFSKPRSNNTYVGTERRTCFDIKEQTYMFKMEDLYDTGGNN